MSSPQRVLLVVRVATLEKTVPALVCEKCHFSISRVYPDIFQVNVDQRKLLNLVNTKKYLIAKISWKGTMKVDVMEHIQSQANAQNV